MMAEPSILEDSLNYTGFHKIVSLNLIVDNFSHLLILIWVILILSRVALNHTTRWTQDVNGMFMRRSKN